MVKQARQTLPDAENPGNSAVSRFNLAYDASHFLALAALRWHGYRSDNRQINFQSLVHTVGFAPVKWRILDNCHKKRNVAQYDGDFSPDEELISELIAVTKELQAAVAAVSSVLHPESTSRSVTLFLPALRQAPRLGALAGVEKTTLQVAEGQLEADVAFAGAGTRVFAALGEEADV